YRVRVGPTGGQRVVPLVRRSRLRVSARPVSRCPWYGRVAELRRAGRTASLRRDAPFGDVRGWADQPDYHPLRGRILAVVGADRRGAVSARSVRTGTGSDDCLG